MKFCMSLQERVTVKEETENQEYKGEEKYARKRLNYGRKVA